MKKTRKFMALLLVLVMVLSLVPANKQEAKAASGAAARDRITLGAEEWSGDNATYTFPDAKVDFHGEAQKIFCISIDNKGSFKLPGTITLGTNPKITGLSKDTSGANQGYLDHITGGEEVTSLTVLGKNITDDEILDFLKSLVFYRNGVAETEEQAISVVANSVNLPNEDNSTVMAIDGELHFYEYVELQAGDQKSWYDAYNGAKSSSFQGMQGYLATITSENEEKYLYNSVHIGTQAWIGGARTLLPSDGYNGFTLDTPEIADDSLKPVQADGSTIVRKWTWLCGPEAGLSFYETNGAGSSAGGVALNDAYTDWNKKSSTEPNNNFTNHGIDVHPATYNQEYALEYGFEEANWNDYNPYNVARGAYGIDGYIVEYSPYNLSGVDGSNETEISMDNASTTVTQVVRADQTTLKANNFIISSTAATTLTADKAKELADTQGGYKNVESVDYTSPKITADPVQLSKIQTGKTGTYKLNYTYEYDAEHKTTVTTYVTVTDDAGDKDDSGVVTTIGANNVEIPVGDIEGLTDAEIVDYVKKATGVTAIQDGEVVARKYIDVDDSSDKVVPTIGSYEVTYTYGGATATVTVNVVADTDTSRIYASNAVISVDQAKNLDLNGAKNACDVYAKNDGATIPATDAALTANTSQLEKINEGKTGEYDLKFTYTYGSKHKDKTAVVTVVDKLTTQTGTDGHNISLGANDTRFAKSVVEQWSPDKFLEEVFKKSEPIAYDNGTKVETSKIKLTSLDKNSDDSYTATFSYDGVTVQTKVTLVDASNISVSGKDFVVPLEDLGNLKEDDVIKLADGTYIDEDGTPHKGDGVKVDPDSLDKLNKMDEPGTIEITLTDETGAATDTVKVTVVDKYETKDDPTPSDPNNKIGVGGNDFCISIEQAKEIMANPTSTAVADMVKKLGNANAKNGADAVEVTSPDLKVDASAIKAELGVYPVEFSYQGVKVTVNATVKEHGGADSQADKTVVPEVNLTGNDFTVPSGVSTIDSAAFEKLADLVAKKNDGTKVDDLTIDPAQLQNVNDKLAAGKVGTLPVRVTAGGKAIIIHVTLTGGSGSNTPTIKGIMDLLGVDEETAKQILDYITKNNIPLDTIKITDKAITNKKDDYDFLGSDFSRLKARANKSTKKTVKVKWVKQSGADGYLIYANQCNNKGKIYKLKFVKDVPNRNITTWTQKKLKKGKYYKYLVVAYKNFGKVKVTIAAAPNIHAVTRGGKMGMAKSVSIVKVGKKKKAKKIALKVGKTAKIKAKEIKAVKKSKLQKHRKIAYETSDPRIATVTARTGKIKAVAKGTCKIWVYAQNGVYKEIKVTVK